ncbi:TlpA family protein disulfide reductase [Hamadaea tsunoensis]|uniref:TlpA family protein disulfide reductase n=1 Tax=Hamadaea tsunoensis TaxID=53368 RepID=UPI0004263297|nr:TlpA disulfide reductase family protein [Hamadaea tsunoensis]
MRRALAILAAGLLLAGCSATPTTTVADDGPDPFPDCGAVVADAVGAGVPDVTVPCFHGGESIRLAQIKGAAVVNLWASWCAPCRKELPAFQALAKKTTGQVTVLGVVTKDTRSAAGSLGEDLGLSFPAVFDADGRLSTELVKQRLATAALPVTLFVKDGRVAYVYQGTALDAATLDKLVTEHLGVAA